MTAPCVECGWLRPLDDLLAVYPIAEPSEPFFVCRPGEQRLCFRLAVGAASQYGISRPEAVAA